MLRAEIRIWQGDYASALSLLEGAPPDGASAQGRIRASFTEALARCRLARSDAEGHTARVALERAEQRARSIGDPRLIADAAIRRGACAVTSRRREEAAQALRQALRVARRSGLLAQEMAAAGSLSYLALQLERYDHAAEWQRASRELALKLGNELVVVKNTVNLGQSRLLLGEWEQAHALFREAADVAEKRGFEYDLLLGLIGLGDACRQLGLIDEALAHLGRAAEIARRRGAKKEAARIAHSLAELAIARGRYEEADRLARHALRLKEEAGDVSAADQIRVRLGEIAEARGDFRTAEQRYDTVIRSPMVERRVRWQARARLAALHAAQHHDQAAEAGFMRAFASMEEGRSELSSPESRLAFSATLRDFHDAYVDFLVGRGRVRAALEVSESGRARLLAEKLRGLGAPVGVSRAHEFQRSARRLGATLLAYRVAPRRSIVWVVTGSAIEVRSLSGEPELCRVVAEHQALVARSRDPLKEERPESRALYDMLLRPVVAQVPRGGRVVLALDGCLHQLNFETLPVPGDQPRYWIDDVTVEVAPSLAVLRTGAAGRRATRPLLVIGDPAVARPEFPALSQAGREVERVAETVPAAERTVYQGSTAEPGVYHAAEPSRFRLIHFAAHAVANRVSPLDSAVILSPKRDDYKLYARDILKTPLDADLVTLSACRSAGARAYAGEGLVGLAWAFMSAGARNVIAGLWNVEDASTADLMEDLYRGLRDGHDPADALRAAKLKMLRSRTAYSKPFYWAPFVVYTRAPGRHAPRTSARQ